MAIPEPDAIAAARRAENFPVASSLVAPAARAPILDFYRVARGADDIADDPARSPADKRARLLELDAVLAGAAPAPGDALAADCARLRRSAARHAADIAHARRLLQAFLADADSRPCQDWSDLMAYCGYSAAPVGRFLLDLHGARSEAVRASDALCAALQILNHIQDCRADHLRLGRCYLPIRWLAAEGLGTESLAASRCTPALRRVLDRVLDRVDALLADAASMPGALAGTGLAREGAGILALARALARRLRRGDPLAGRVALPRWEKALRFGVAALRQGGGRSGSSFALAMRLFPAAARPAVAAIHALARRLDDIADGPASAAMKATALAAWRAALDDIRQAAAEEPLLAALLGSGVELPLSEFHALIDGMETDSLRAPRAPDFAALQLYCRQVAGSIGVLVLAACGLRAPADTAYAIALGEALQLVNILRDIDEDARSGRLYVPAEMLRAAGLDPAADIDRLLAAPGFASVRASLAARARAAFERADALAPATGATRIFAVRLIAGTYRGLLARLERAPAGAPRAGLVERVAVVFAALRAPPRR